MSLLFAKYLFHPMCKHYRDTEDQNKHIHLVSVIQVLKGRYCSPKMQYLLRGALFFS